jgi:serine protease
LPIPDDDETGVADIGTASGRACTIQSLSLAVDITHTCDGDLSANLTAPSGITVTVFGQPSSCLDTVPMTITSADSDGLASLAGLSGVGMWTLRVFDHTGADVGTLNAWTLDITCGASGMAGVLPPAD